MRQSHCGIRNCLALLAMTEPELIEKLQTAMYVPVIAKKDLDGIFSGILVYYPE